MSSRLIDGLRLIRLVGEGGAARVLLGEDARGAKLAVKVHSDDALAELEASMLTRVLPTRSPALRAFGRLDANAAHGIPKGAPALVLEWVEGESVADWLGHSTPTFAQVVAIAHDVALALDEMHSAGVCHGDVKPENILVEDHDPKRRRQAGSARRATAKLIDMSLAVPMGAEWRGMTAAYAAPEHGRGRASASQDLFSLGRVIEELAQVAARKRARAKKAARDPLAEIVLDWVRLLTSKEPGHRPRARWIVESAAQALGESLDVAGDWQARVRRSYLAAREDELAPLSGARAKLELADAMTELEAEWIDARLSASRALAESPGEGDIITIGPIDELRRVMWLVALVGDAAATWGGELARAPSERVIERAWRLARTRDPRSWTLADLVGETSPQDRAPLPRDVEHDDVALAAALLGARPDPSLLLFAEERVRKGKATPALGRLLADALRRRGELGRASSVAQTIEQDAPDLVAEIARRMQDEPRARAFAKKAARSSDPLTRARGVAVEARLVWAAGRSDEALDLVDAHVAPAVQEIEALALWSKGEYAEALSVSTHALAGEPGEPERSRLVAVRAMALHGLGRAEESARAFEEALRLATLGGAVEEEASYATGLAAAASDAGRVDQALEAATRAALLWDRLDNPARASRAWLARAVALGTVGNAHDSRDAAEIALRRARAGADALSAAFACLAIVETTAPRTDDPSAASCLDEALALTKKAPTFAQISVLARVLVYAPERLAGSLETWDARARDAGGVSLWEWWAHRARACLLDGSLDSSVVRSVTALAEQAAPISVRGPGLFAARELARALGDGDAVVRLGQALGEVRAVLLAHVPESYRARVEALEWVGARERAPAPTLSAEQGSKLELLVRLVADAGGLSTTLERVLDAMLIWAGVERGLVLLFAPDGRLVPRAARNLAGKSLSSAERELSMTLARRAADRGEMVIVEDARADSSDTGRSVHALSLRSVLVVPLMARGQTLGVVYLDDRSRPGAFGTGERAWVSALSSVAAMAIASARDLVDLRRAARRARRSAERVRELLAERERELEEARRAVDARNRPAGPFSRYVGDSPPVRRMLELLARAAVGDVPILLEGESGTGKEILARAIHEASPRKDAAFVTQNCAALPDPLLEATLFGHVRGAFTGAVATRAGLFEAADRGTLFLDEIGEMSLAMQAKLLRVLEDGEIRAIGALRSRRVDVRIVAATHRDLEAMVREGAFREDLFYRLDVVRVRVPPLRERREDLATLAFALIERHAGGRDITISRAAMRALEAHDFPGNVRELENAIRRALVLGGDRIEPDALGELGRTAAIRRVAAVESTGTLRERIDALERDAVEEALRVSKGNQSEAARALGLSRYGLHKMLKRLSINPIALSRRA